MPDLQELDDLLAPARGGPGVPREEVETAIQALLFHQFLYEDGRGAKGAYDLVRKHRGFFNRYVGAMGLSLVIEQTEGMVGVVPGTTAYAWRESRLTKDETLVLLALRFLLETGTMQGRLTDSGRVEATTDELHDVLRMLARVEPPGETKLAEILAEFRRRGLVRVEDRNTAEQLTPIVVLPAVRLVCTDQFARHVTAWASASEAERGDGDVLGFIAARRAEALAEDARPPEPDGERWTGEDGADTARGED
jgi:hypothetical protein